jgi:hypothetical protein
MPRTTPTGEPEIFSSHAQEKASKPGMCTAPTWEPVRTFRKLAGLRCAMHAGKISLHSHEFGMHTRESAQVAPILSKNSFEAQHVHHSKTGAFANFPRIVREVRMCTARRREQPPCTASAALPHGNGSLRKKKWEFKMFTARRRDQLPTPEFPSPCMGRLQTPRASQKTRVCIACRREQPPCTESAVLHAGACPIFV